MLTKTKMIEILGCIYCQNQVINCDACDEEFAQSEEIICQSDYHFHKGCKE